MNITEQINTHKYLYLDKLLELNDLELEIWISEARIDSEAEENLQDILESATTTEVNPIILDEKCKRYKLVFENYISYSVLNESYTVWDENEVFSGNLFRSYSKSKFLDYINEAVEMFLVENNRIGKLQHFEVACLNHIIDIATCNKPIIEELF